MKENQSALELNRGLSSNFWWLRSANHVKFTEECVKCMEKYVLGKKMFTTRLKLGFAIMRSSQKDSLSSRNEMHKILQDK